jgi:AraC-like DNA-binding protein
LRRFGSRLRDIEDHKARIHHDALVELVELVIQRTGDERLGLHCAMLEGSLVPLLDPIVEMSLSARDGLERFLRYGKLVHDGLRVRFQEQDGRATLEIGLDPRLRCPPALGEYCLATAFVMGRSLGAGLARKEPGTACVEVFFSHPQPSDVSDYHRFFRVPVHFDAPTNCVQFPVAMLNRQRSEGAPVVAAALERHADQSMMQARRPERLADRVRRLVTAELARGTTPSELHIAGLLRTTPRTLRRRLSADGASFHVLVDDVRRDRALTHLRAYDTDLEGAAAQAGFSSDATLRRAVKRWTGRSVGELRGAPPR